MAIVEIRKTIAAGVPALPFERIAKAIVGKNYQLSLVICGDSLAQRINKAYRKKTYRPNVLSFPLSKKEGEIFLNVRKAAREAKAYGVSYRARAALLFIHALLHLKGHRHGITMERLEQKFLRGFGVDR